MVDHIHEHSPQHKICTCIFVHKMYMYICTQDVYLYICTQDVHVNLEVGYKKHLYSKKFITRELYYQAENGFQILKTHSALVSTMKSVKIQGTIYQ